ERRSGQSENDSTHGEAPVLGGISVLVNLASLADVGDAVVDLLVELAGAGLILCASRAREGSDEYRGRQRIAQSRRGLLALRHLLALEGLALPASRGAVDGLREVVLSGLALEPVAERLHGGTGLHESLAHGGHDLVGAGTVPVDADGVDLGGDGLAGDGR